MLSNKKDTFSYNLSPETHTKRQATQHGCLPGLLGDGDNRIKIVYGEEKNILYWDDKSPRQNKNLVNLHGKPKKPTMEGLLSFVLFESPFTSVSTVSRGHPSLVSLLVSIFIYFPLKVFRLARIT
jgi:hypothetical protein